MTSMTLSRKRAALRTVWRRRSQSTCSAFEHQGEVDRAEVAALVGEEGLLAAGVGRFEFADQRRRVVAVEAVEEDDARLAVLQARSTICSKTLRAGRVRPSLLVAGVDELVVGILLDRLHEGFGEADGDVEVGEDGLIPLAHDEIHDIGMVDAQDPHVGAAPGAALLDRLGGGVEDLHEGEGAAGDAAGRLDDVVGGTDAREGEAGAAAALVDEGGLLDRFEDLFHRVADRQDEAGGELAEFAAGIHQRRRIREEFEGGHQSVEFVGQSLGIDAGLEAEFGAGNRFGDAAEHRRRGLDRLAVKVAFEVAAFEDGDGVFRELGRRVGGLFGHEMGPPFEDSIT